VVDAIRTYATAAKNIVPLTNSHSKSFTEVLVTVLTVAILSVGGAGALRILARK
jgi:putative NADH-flavin reductase